MKITDIHPPSKYSWASRVIFIALLMTIIAGIGFRSAGYFDGTISLWLDESTWLKRLLNNPITELGKRPIGYMWLSKILIGVRLDEALIRMTSYIPSLLSIWLTYLISIKVFKSRVTVFIAVYLFCLNPIFIAFAKEFKPYAMEAFVHLFLVWLTLRYTEAQTRILLGCLLISCFIGLTLAYNIMFLFPSIMLVLMAKSYQQGDKRAFGILLASSLSLILLIVVLKMTLLSSLNFERQEIYWGKKYGVFFLGHGLVDQIAWLFWKYAGIVQASLQAKVFWSFNPHLELLLTPIIYIAHIVGFVALVLRRNVTHSLLFILPIAVIILFNILGMWPFKAFRTNLFMFSYFAFITLVGLDFLLTSQWRPVKISAIAIAIFMVLVSLPLDLSYHNIKRKESLSYHSEMRNVLEHIYRTDTAFFEGNASGTIYIDGHSLPQVNFYTFGHPVTAPKLEPFFSNYIFRIRRTKTGTGMKNFLRNRLRNKHSGERVWIIISKRSWFSEVASDPFIRKNLQFENNFNGGNLLLLWVDEGATLTN